MEPTRDLQALVEALVGPAELTPPEVAAESGIDIEQARRLWRALGFPPVPDTSRIFTRADVDVLHGVRRLIDRYGIEWPVVVQLARLTGRSLSRIADAQVDAGGPLMNDPAVVLPEFAADFERLMAYVWRRQLLAAILRRAAFPSESQHDVTVGFADLVGFTALSQALDASELAGMVDRFEALGYEHVPLHGGRVIKMIGDEIMFAADDVAGGAAIALALVEAHAADPDLPDIRVGLASGPTLQWDGDLYGPTVNLASRLVNVARPGTVLVSETIASALGDASDVMLRPLRPVRLQGIGRVPTWVLRRGGGEPAARRGSKPLRKRR
jgi:adenylate cyclase